MRESIIREMFSGKRGTYDRVDMSEEYKEAESKMYVAVDSLLEKLTAEQQKLFHDAHELIVDTSAVYAEDHFIEGFKFGLLIGVECARE